MVIGNYTEVVFARTTPEQKLKIVEETRALVERVLGPSVELSLQVDGELGDTLVEREQLDHVILNLAANYLEGQKAGFVCAILRSCLPRRR